MVPPGCKSEDSVNFERWLHSPVQNKTPPTSERPIDNQWLCKPPQEPLPEGGFACTDQQEGSREGKGSDLSSLLQQVVHCPQTKPEMAANLGPQCSKPIFECKNIQNGDLRNNSNLLTTRGMGDIAGFQQRLFYIPVHTCSRKFFRFHFHNQLYQFWALPFGLSTAPMEFTCVVKEVRLMVQSQGIRIHEYLDDWLI